MHISFVVESLIGGGVQHRTRSLASAFAAAGHKVDIYVSKDAEKSSALARPGVVVRELVGTTRSQRTRSLVAELRKSRPDVLFSTGTTLHPVAVAAKRRVPETLLVIRADSYPLRRISPRDVRPFALEPIRRVARKLWFRSADLVIAVSPHVAEAVRLIAPHTPVTTLSSPVVTPEFQADLDAEPPDHPWVQDDVPIALAVGRIALAKDYPTLLRAAARVMERRPLRLVILGDGKLRDRRVLQNLIEQLGIADKVAWIGWTGSVAQWLKVSSLFVTTSIWEGCPGAVIEALASGTPIVATDCPGDTRRLLRDGELGSLLKVGDVTAIAEAIEATLDRPGEPSARQLAARPFEEAPACAAYLEVVQDFLTGVARSGAASGR